MSTEVGSGRSMAAKAAPAAGEAVASARRMLGERKPDFGFVFAGPDHDLAEVMRRTCEAAAGAALVGCTTAGEFTQDGLTHGGVVVLLVASDEAEQRLAFARGLKAEHGRAADELTRDFSKAQHDAHSRQGWRPPRCS